MSFAFVSVGATAPFDLLVEAVLSKQVLHALRSRGFRRVGIQCGASALPLIPTNASRGWHMEREGMDIDIWDFKPSLTDDFLRADLVISHAGSGTIVDVLRLGKPLIVVPNPLLLHNHQEELALALQNRGYLRSSSIGELGSVISAFDASLLNPFPAFDGRKFQSILDDEAGFA